MNRLGALALVLFSRAVCLADDPAVRFESGRLWVRSEGAVAVRPLLESVGEKTGVEFVIDPELAAGRIDVVIEGLELERAIRQLLADIPKAAGHTTSYVSDASGKPRVARVMVFGAGKAPAGSGSAEGAAVAAPTPSSADLETQKARMIEGGISAETAERFIAITGEMSRLQKTPGAVEALLQSEDYRKTIREIAEAQGKVTPERPSP
ncbi:MAG: hypothetical protein ACREQY_08575 [Candidatus Binatia bacterium]